jgi:hypothetical protein
LFAFLAVATAFAVGAPLAQAVTYTVNNTTDTPIGQQCTGTTNCSLREAVESADADLGSDVIEIDTGTYPLDNGELAVTDDLTVVNPGAGSVTISGSNAGRIFNVSGIGTDLVLRFLTLTNGNVTAPSGNPAEGGAIYGDAGTTIGIESSTVTNSEVQSDVSAEGGGIWSEGAVTIGNASGSPTPSVVTQNTATGTMDSAAACGGGIAIVDGGDLTVGPFTMITGNTSQTISSNGLAHGAGVWFVSDGHQATFTQATVSGNNANANVGGLALGAGVDLELGTASFVRSTVSGNTATSNSALAFGGGIAVTDAATLDLTFSTVAGNTATVIGNGFATGGGVGLSLFDDSSFSATGSTIASNAVSAPCGCVAGPGIFDFNGNTVTLAGTILAGNTGEGQQQCDGAVIQSGGYDVLGPIAYCGYAAGTGDKTGVKNPKLKPLGDYGGPTETMLPQAGSLAVDLIPAADTLCTSISTDQRDVSRPQGGNCDAGSVEALPPTMVISPPGNVDFPYTLPSAFNTDSLTVENTGELDAGRPTVSLGAPFSATGCAAPIPAGGSCTLDLKFSPVSGGAFVTTVKLRSGAVRASAKLTGIGWAPVVAPSIPGTPSVGYKTSVGTGQWPGVAATFTAQWIRCDADGTSNCGDIPGATFVFAPSLLGSTRTVYTPVLADAGHTLKVRLVAKSVTGVDSAPVTTAASAVVTRTTPTLLQTPSIDRGSAPQVGVTLTAYRGQWTGAPDSYTFQWIRCDADGTSNCTDIAGRKTNQYKPANVDLGHTLRVRVVAKNPAGSSAPATSPPSGVVSS